MASDKWNYGPHEPESPADFWYRRDEGTGEVQWYDDATFSWKTVPGDRWPHKDDERPRSTSRPSDSSGRLRFDVPAGHPDSVHPRAEDQPTIDDLPNSAPVANRQLAREHLLHGERAERITVTVNPSRHAGETWIVTLHYGWAQTNVALCDYPHPATGIAYALGGALGCDVELSADLEEALGLRSSDAV